VRDRDKARVLPADAELVVGDVARLETLPAAVAGIDAVVLTLGSHGGKADAESVDYGGVRNVLRTLGSRTARLALMTSIGVTNREGAYNRSTEAHDWKRRSERLVRASGLPYTIVRPGWFDLNAPDQHRLILLQGDTLGSDEAVRKTFELVATTGPEPDDFDALFAALEADPRGALDGVHDTANMPPIEEPQRAREDLEAVVAQAHSRGHEPGARRAE
jgi:NAD(P)H-binding